MCFDGALGSGTSNWSNPNPNLKWEEARNLM
jgi:hypothetical protein